MKNNIKTILTLCILFLSVNAFAGSIETGNPVRERSNKEAMTELIYKKFTRLQEMIADEKYTEARAGLKALTEKRLNDFEKANINQFLGYIDSNEENYTEAAKHFQAALDADALTNPAQFSLMLQMAQFQIMGGNYKKGLDDLHNYYKVTDKITDTTFFLEANAYARLEDFRTAIPILKKAISLSDKPRETWYYLLYSMHMQLSQFIEASKVLETLIKINPNKEDYWKRLSDVYFNLKKDDKSLAVLVLADKNGMLKGEKERLRLFKMYHFLNIPFEAGKVLEKSLKDGVVKPTFKRWEDLGKIWYASAEMDKALDAYTEASKLATDGKIDYQRAYIYFDREEYNKAKNALSNAIEKGGLTDKKVGKAWLLMGMAESESGNDYSAIKYLKNAAKFKNTRKNAIQWITHLEKQIKRDKAEAARKKLLADDANITES